MLPRVESASQVQNFSTIIKDSKQLTTVGINNLNTTVTTVGNKYKLTESLYTELGGLVNDAFKPWYCKQFHRLGVDKVMQLASIARADGREPARLFSRLLKDAA